MNAKIFPVMFVLMLVAMPASALAQEVRDAPVPAVIVHNDGEKTIGGETDEHGCLGTAGYQWSDEKQACVRPWNGEVQISPMETGDGITEPAPVAMPYDTNKFIGVERVDSENPELVIAPVSSGTNPVIDFFQAITGFFKNLFGF